MGHNIMHSKFTWPRDVIANNSRGTLWADFKKIVGVISDSVCPARPKLQLRIKQICRFKFVFITVRNNSLIFFRLYS